MSRTVAKPVEHNECARMSLETVLKVVCGVRCSVFRVLFCVVVCRGCFGGPFFEKLFDPFDEESENPTTAQPEQNPAMTPPPDPHLTY